MPTANARGRAHAWYAALAVLIGTAPLLYTMASRWEEQRDRYQAGLRGEALQRQVETLLAEDRTREATRLLRDAVRLDPSSAQTRFLLGLARLRSGDGAQADAAFEHALELQPDHAGAHHQLGQLYARRDELEPAVRHFRAALRARPGLARARAHLGFVLARQGLWDFAVRDFARYAELRPESAHAHALLGAALAALGRSRDARTHLERALALDADHADARLTLRWLEARAADAAG